MKKLFFQTLAFALCLLCCGVVSHGQKPILFATVELPTSPPNKPCLPKLNAADFPKVAAANLETDLLNEINRLRTNPALYAATLERYRRYFVGKELHLPGQTTILTGEGVAAVDEAIRVLKGTPAVEVFVGDENLTRAAFDHVRDIAASGEIGHNDSQGETPVERVLRYGVWRGELQELVSYYSPTAPQIIFSLLVDDGVRGRGHRRALLKSNLRSIGIKTGDSREFGKLCVIVLTESFIKRSN